MNNAAKHNIRQHIHAPKRKTKAVVQPTGGILKMDAKTKGRSRSTQGQSKSSTGCDAANGFLKRTFLPKLCQVDTAIDTNISAKIERDFYQSLSLLSRHYAIDPVPTWHHPFPYNLCLAIADIKTRLAQCSQHWDDLMLLHEKGKTYLVSKETFNTGTNLYFIPVAPLLRMLSDHRHRKAAHLLLSVCCYLYHQADIPYYRQQGSFIAWQLEMIADWCDMDDENAETEAYRSELADATCIGDRMEKKISNENNLVYLAKRLEAFTPSSPFEKQCGQITAKALSLMLDFPNRSIFDNAPECQQSDDPYDECHSMSMHSYISFIWESNGCLIENICDNINSELNEYGAIDHPTIFYHFDDEKPHSTDLSFEDSLFDLMNDLCNILNDYTSIH